MELDEYSVAVIGAGIAGVATAYYLSTRHGLRRLVLLDPNAPLSVTTAQSGENYRNWWPHPVMTRFTNDSIDLIEELARKTDNRMHLTRGGYILATRGNADDLISDLHRGYGSDSRSPIRVHGPSGPSRYHVARSEDWGSAPSGVDVLSNQSLIRSHYPEFSEEIATVLHIRRAGTVSSQQMGQFMLESIREAGGRFIPGRVILVERDGSFQLDVKLHGETKQIRAEAIVNAAGPYVCEIAGMLGVDLPITNVLQQKIAFEDTAGAIPRQMPFSVDLDKQFIDWTDEEREMLREDSSKAWLADLMPGAVHCRPDGGDRQHWVKLGWAFNTKPSEVEWPPELDDFFPEIVLRGASRLNPGLKAYYGRFPRQFTHHAGYYSMTPENWPLIGSIGVDGAFVVGALSGFGTMAACAAGALCASVIAGRESFGYAGALSPARYKNCQLMDEFSKLNSRGIL
ncbi:MAG: FAD-binding oxidoreductase [Paracoccaceae bacterium]|nr:FAD-binding oxidoreductase [Paracoccaceae bacterium]